MSVKIYPTVYQALFAQNYAKKHFNRIVGAKRDIIAGEQKKTLSETFRRGAKTALKLEIRSAFDDRVKSSPFALFQYTGSTTEVRASTFLTTTKLVKTLNKLGYKFMPQSYTAYYWKKKLIPEATAKNTKLLAGFKKRITLTGSNYYLNKDGILVADGPGGKDHTPEDGYVIAFESDAINYDFFTKGYFFEFAIEQPKGAMIGFGIEAKSFQLTIPLANKVEGKYVPEKNYAILFFTPKPSHVFTAVAGVVENSKFRLTGVTANKIPVRNYGDEWLEMNPLLGEIVTKLYTETAPVGFVKRIDLRESKSVKAKKLEEEKEIRLRDFVRTASLERGMSEYEFWKNVLAPAYSNDPRTYEKYKRLFEKYKLSKEVPKPIQETSSNVIEPEKIELFNVPKTTKAGVPKSTQRTYVKKLPQDYVVLALNKLTGKQEKKAVPIATYFSLDNPSVMYTGYFMAARREWLDAKKVTGKDIKFYEFLKENAEEIIRKNNFGYPEASAYYADAVIYFQSANY